MKIPFFKYQGTGNDFIIIDNRSLHWKPTAAEVSLLCDRHFGIGADGFMLLSSKEGFDFSMTYFNSDGLESTMCGNGGRCMTAFAKSLGLAGSTARFWAIDGAHEAEILDDASTCIYRIKMRDTRIGEAFDDGFLVDTGSPHFVKFVDDAWKTDVCNAGRELCHDRRFDPGGANVDFVEVRDDCLFVRTYERGVENETLSCGTGVTASAIVTAFVKPGNQGSRNIKTPGGELKVRFIRDGDSFTGVWLEGPARFVFWGEAEI